MGDALHTGGTSGGLGVTSAREARLAQAGLLAVQGPTVLDPRTGVLHGPGSTSLVTGTGDTAPMAYNIAPHQWVTSRRTADGPYLGALDAVRKAATTAAPSSGSRIDVIWVRQADNDPTVLTPDAATADEYGVTQGVSSTGTPAKPALPVGAEELATATVAAGATATNGAGVTITNTARQTVPRGVPIPVRNQAGRDLLAQYDGLQVYRLDTGRYETSRGGAWDTGWTSYTPTLSGTGWALGNGTLTGRYRQDGGGTVVFEIALTFGSTSTYGTGQPGINLPVASRSAYHRWPGVLRDINSARRIPIAGYQYGGTTNFVVRVDGSADSSELTATNPIVLAANTTIGIGGSYEAA